jgi:hypothetical protein
VATSAVYTFNPTLAEMFTEAGERAGIRPAAFGAEHLVSARNSMNYLTLEMATQEGDRVYAIDQETASLTSTASTSVIALASGTIDVLDERVILTLSGETVSTPLSRISREDWLMIPDKTTTGTPSQFYVDHGVTLNTPTMYVWPIADAAATLTYDRMRFIQDAVALSDTADVRRTWLDALVWGLAARLAFKFNMEKFEPCQKMYLRAIDIAKMESRARAPIVIEARGFGRARHRRA